MNRSVISGTGRYIPPKTVTNFDLEERMNTSDEWIQQRSGIKERHYAERGIGSSDLAYEASLKAIADAKIDKSEIDFIIAATLSPDHYFPGIGVLVQAKLGLENIGALDVRNQCSGFIYTVSTMGVTGARSELSNAVVPLVESLKSMTKTPICVGFGVSKPEHAGALAEAGAEGVIVGSAVVKIIEENLSAADHGQAALAEFIQSMINVLKEKCKA